TRKWPGICRAHLIETDETRPVRHVRRRPVQCAAMMYRHRAGLAGQRDDLVLLEQRIAWIDRAGEYAVDEVTEHRTLMRARYDEQRTAFLLDVLKHEADRKHVIIGVRIERPVLVPFDGGPAAGCLRIELRSLQAHGRTKKGFQHRAEFAGFQHVPE